MDIENLIKEKEFKKILDSVDEIVENVEKKIEKVELLTSMVMDITNLLNQKHRKFGQYLAECFKIFDGDRQMINENDDPILCELFAMLCLLENEFNNITELIPISATTRKAFTLFFEGWMFHASIIEKKLKNFWPNDIKKFKELYTDITTNQD